MKAFWQTLSPRDQALLIAIQLFERKQFDELTALLPNHQRDALHSKTNVLNQLERKDRVTLLVARLDELFKSNDNDIFQLIHESWIVEALNKEQPIIAATIMRTFANRLIERIQSYSSPSLHQQTMQLYKNKIVCRSSKSFITSFFAREWKNLFSTVSVKNSHFNHLTSLSPKEMEHFLQTIGTVEVAGFFSLLGIRKSATYLMKFQKGDQKKIVEALQSFSSQHSSGWSEHDNEDVFNADSADSLFINAGLHALAFALRKDNSDVAQICALKLSHTLGSSLLEMIENNVSDKVCSTLFQQSLNRKAHDLLSVAQKERVMI